VIITDAAPFADIPNSGSNNVSSLNKPDEVIKIYEKAINSVSKILYNIIGFRGNGYTAKASIFIVFTYTEFLYQKLLVS